MHNSVYVAIAALSVGLSSFSPTQKQTPPGGSAPKDFTLPARNTFILPNGIGVTMVRFGNVPKATIRAVVRTGNINEGEHEVWLADLVGDMLKEGTSTRTAKQIAADAAGMGGSLDVTVGEDQSFINADVLTEYAPKMAALVADVLCNPSFPATELARLKNDRIRQLSISKADPNAIATEKFREVLYGKHPYGRIFPTEAMLERYTIEMVKRFYDENFGAARTHVYVAGKFDQKAMENAIRQAFTAWRRGTDPVPDIPQPQSHRAIHIIDRPGAPQATVYIGLPVINPSHPQYRALLVVNALLGGSFASRITSNIREDKGYTYSPGSTVSSRYRDAYWAEFASITTDVTGPAIKEIFFEIDRLQREAPTEAELHAIQNYMAGVFVLQNSSPAGIINQLSFLNLHGLPESYLTDYVRTIHAVTPEEVRQLAAAHLRAEDMVIVIAGDKKRIGKQVAGFGKVIG